MFYINKDIELNTAMLQKMISRFTLNEKPRLEKYKNYYDGIQAILQKSYADPSKPCNKTVINYCASIANSYAGYTASPGYISYSSEEDIEDVMDILRYNDYQAHDASFLLDALVYGVANELMFNDITGQTRFRLINPTTSFGVYDDTLTGDLLYFIRFYKANEWDDSDLYKVDVYTDTMIKHYDMSGLNGALTFIDEEPHYFSQCPANIFYLPDGKSIYDCILTIQDSINELLSAEVDDYQAFVDSILVFEGVDLDKEDVKSLREDRAVGLPEGAKAYYLTKTANDAQIENILKRLHDSAYRVSSCVDFSSESFTGGVTSGVAIRFKLSGMETRAGKIEAEMKKALQRRVEIICGVASLKLGEEVFRDIQINFKRNVPEDITATINMINGLKGTVSDSTLLEQLPFISDVNAELEKVEAQKLKNIDLFAAGAFHVEQSEEEEEPQE